MLNEITTEFIFHFMLVFARLGTAFSLFPAIGDRYIFMRGRLAFALVVSLVLCPILKIYLPTYSENFSLSVNLIAIEILIGIIISIGTKFYYWSLHFIGQIISMQSGLGSATFFDPSQKSQVAIFTSFLFLLTTIFIFSTNTHHLFIESVIDSYKRFPPGEWLNISDMNKFIVLTINDSFIVAFKVASPFLVISLIMLIGSGVLARLMPNLQVFFVITPAQILVIFGTLYIAINHIVETLTNSMINSLNIVLT
jgi:flagellar biosynthetic protein FliR